MMRGPVWGGPQAAGKRHSQPFSAKRLPHPRGVCRPTKPVFVDTGVAVERSTPLLVPVRHFRCFRLLTFLMIIMSHLVLTISETCRSICFFFFRLVVLRFGRTGLQEAA